MLHAHDVLTLCLEEFIIRASRRYGECREKMADASHHEQRALKRLSARHLANIEKLVMLRACIMREREATARAELAAVTNKKRRVRLQDGRVLHDGEPGCRERRSSVSATTPSTA